MTAANAYFLQQGKGIIATEFSFLWCRKNALFIIIMAAHTAYCNAVKSLNMTFVHLEWIEHIGVITLNANAHILYFTRVGSLLTRVSHLHVNTLHAQDFAYPGQENKTKHYSKFIYFGFDFRFYSFFLKHIWMAYFFYAWFGYV